MGGLFDYPLRLNASNKRHYFEPTKKELITPSYTIGSTVFLQADRRRVLERQSF